MSKHGVKIVAVSLLVACSVPAFAQSQSGATSGAVGGAVTGAVVGGPVGAAVGGVAGAVVGGIIGPDDRTRVREYVVQEHRPSITYQQPVAVGTALPSDVVLYPIPDQVGVKTPARYTVINNRTYLVDPNTRQIVDVIE